ncbi:MAG: hypothetical protein ACI957_005299 [Verrucomicrobiales bacterium]|jgi:hypothetical protein
MHLKPDSISDAPTHLTLFFNANYWAPLITLSLEKADLFDPLGFATIGPLPRAINVTLLDSGSTV